MSGEPLEGLDHQTRPPREPVPNPIEGRGADAQAHRVKQQPRNCRPIRELGVGNPKITTRWQGGHTKETLRWRPTPTTLKMPYGGARGARGTSRQQNFVIPYWGCGTTWCENRVQRPTFPAGRIAGTITGCGPNPKTTEFCRALKDTAPNGCGRDDHEQDSWGNIRARVREAHSGVLRRN